MASKAEFEDHCWKDVMPAADIKLYSPYARETFIGPDVAFVAIDLYNLVYRGGRATIGPLTLGSAELASLRSALPTAIYTIDKREVSLRVEELERALELPDAIVRARLAA